MMKQVVSKPQFENVIDGILKKAEYRHLKNALRDLIERAKEAIQNWLLNILKKTFSNVEGAGAISNRLSTIFMVIGILVVSAIIVIIILKVNRTFDKKRRVKEILGEKIDSKTTPQSLREKAKTLLSSKDYRQAVRYDFIALLLLMHEKNVVYLDETKTNEEIYNYLKRQKFLSLKDFEYLSRTFNAVWYGHKPLEESSYKLWAQNLEHLWNEVIDYEEKSK